MVLHGWYQKKDDDGDDNDDGKVEDSDDDFYLIFAADLELNAFGAIILMVDFSTPKVLWQMQNSWERRKQFSEGGQNKFWTKIE